MSKQRWHFWHFWRVVIVVLGAADSALRYAEEGRIELRPLVFCVTLALSGYLTERGEEQATAKGLYDLAMFWTIARLVSYVALAVVWWLGRPL